MRRWLMVVGIWFVLTSSAFAAGHGPIKLAWDAVTLDTEGEVTTILYYAIRWGTSSGAQNSGFTVAGGVTQVTVQGLDPAQTYWFKVYAINANGEGVGSNEIQGRPTLILHR